MIKNLRFVLMSMLLMLTGSVFAEDVTINFDDDYAALFPTLPGVSSSASGDNPASTDGDFSGAATSTAVSGVTVTLVPADDAKTPNRLWTSSPRLRMYSGTFTVTGTDITKIVFDAGSNFNLSTTQGTLDGKTWTGEKTAEVTFDVAKNTQLRKITVTLGEGGGEVTPPTPPTPTEKKNRVFKKVSSIESGKSYLLVAEGKAAQAITANYGYLKVDDVTDNNGEVTRPSDNTNEFVFEATDGGFTIKQADGRYLYQTGAYNSFNVNAEPTEGQVWTVEAQADGTFKITNTSVNKYIQYSTNYTSYGSYADEQGVMPALYVFDREEDKGNEPVVIAQKAANIAAFQALASDTEAELTLTNAQVLYVNVYNNTKELFVRDATGAIDLYELGIEAEAGQVLNGTVVGKRGVRSGFTYAMIKSDNTDASTVTVGAKQEVVPAAISSLDEAAYDAYGCDLVKITGVKVSADGKKAMAGGDELALYDRFKLGLTNGLDEEKEYDITGLIYDGGTTYGTELVVTAVTLAGGGEIVEDPATSVPSIEALLGLESPSANLELTLTNAKVLFNDNNYIYVRENGKALCFYHIDALKEVFKNNAVVNGKIEVDYEVYKLLPEVKANKNTNADNLTVVESEEEAEPVQTTLADVAAGKNVCDLVTLTATMVKEVTYKEDGVTVNTTTYYLQDGDTKLVVVNNGKGLNKIEEGTEVIVTGIVNTNNNAYQVKLTKTVPDTTGISDMTIGSQADDIIFNLAGQRIEKVQRGINIIGGKKLMVK